MSEEDKEFLLKQFNGDKKAMSGFLFAKKIASYGFRKGVLYVLKIELIIAALCAILYVFLH